MWISRSKTDRQQIPAVPVLDSLGLNMFGDAVRDLLDPRLRGRLGRYGAGRDAS